jgi:ferrous iron transport protein A
VRTAAYLNIGEKGILRQVTDELLSVKLMEMGFLPGYEIQLVRKAPLGCPLYMKIQDNLLAIRATEAVNMVIE